jgi:hypothetical protein
MQTASGVSRAPKVLGSGGSRIRQKQWEKEENELGKVTA